MKAVRIDFVPKHHARWIWAFTTFLCASIVAFTASKLLQVQSAHQDLAAQQNTLHDQLKASQQAIQKSQPSPDQIKQIQHVQLIAKFLQADFNKPLAALENLKIPGVRLRSLNLDYPQDSLEVELELPSFEHIARVTEVLGYGYNSNPWRFLGATSQTLSNPVVATPNPPAFGSDLLLRTTASGKYVGRWRVKLATL